MWSQPAFFSMPCWHRTQATSKHGKENIDLQVSREYQQAGANRSRIHFLVPGKLASTGMSPPQCSIPGSKDLLPIMPLDSA